MQSRHAPLQVEIRERQGEYWFCKHAGQDIPYSEVPSTDQIDEHGELPVNCRGWITELENTVQGKETHLEHNLLWRVIRLKPQVCTGWITVLYWFDLCTGWITVQDNCADWIIVQISSLYCIAIGWATLCQN